MISLTERHHSYFQSEMCPVFSLSQYIFSFKKSFPQHSNSKQLPPPSKGAKQFAPSTKQNYDFLAVVPVCRFTRRSALETLQKERVTEGDGHLISDEQSRKGHVHTTAARCQRHNKMKSWRGLRREGWTSTAAPRAI